MFALKNVIKIFAWEILKDKTHVLICRKGVLELDDELRCLVFALIQMFQNLLLRLHMINPFL